MMDEELIEDSGGRVSEEQINTTRRDLAEDLDDPDAATVEVVWEAGIVEIPKKFWRPRREIRIGTYCAMVVNGVWRAITVRVLAKRQCGVEVMYRVQPCHHSWNSEIAEKAPRGWWVYAPQLSPLPEGEKLLPVHFAIKFAATGFAPKIGVVIYGDQFLHPEFYAHMPSDLAESPILACCPHCLAFSTRSLEGHDCFPNPGVEVWRQDPYRLFLLDCARYPGGAVEALIQNLSVLMKLSVKRKMKYLTPEQTNPFRFYMLTHDKDGIIGAFSRHRRACTFCLAVLWVISFRRGQGLGRGLVRLAQAITGTWPSGPEWPLSKGGTDCFTSIWHDDILTALQELVRLGITNIDTMKLMEAAGLRERDFFHRRKHPGGLTALRDLREEGLIDGVGNFEDGVIIKADAIRRLNQLMENWPKEETSITFQDDVAGTRPMKLYREKLDAWVGWGEASPARPDPLHSFTPPEMPPEVEPVCHAPVVRSGEVAPETPPTMSEVNDDDSADQHATAEVPTIPDCQVSPVMAVTSVDVCLPGGQAYRFSYNQPGLFRMRFGRDGRPLEVDLQRGPDPSASSVQGNQ